MNKRLVLVSAVLAASLVLAVVGATAALRLIGNGTFGPGGKALSEADVTRSLARVAATPTTRPSPVATPGQSGRHSSPRASHSPGNSAARNGVYTAASGSVFASCASGQVTLTSWIPSPGFGVDGDASGPAASAWVKFKSDSAEVTVTATCMNGRPHFLASADERRGGGGSGRGGSGRDGGGT